MILTKEGHKVNSNTILLIKAEENKHFNGSLKIPTFIQHILSEVYEDFQDESKKFDPEVYKALKKLSSYDMLNIIEATRIFEYVFPLAIFYQNIRNIDKVAMLNNPYSEYLEIYIEAQKDFEINQINRHLVASKHFIIFSFININFDVCLHIQ